MMPEKSRGMGSTEKPVGTAARPILKPQEYQILLHVSPRNRYKLKASIFERFNCFTVSGKRDRDYGKDARDHDNYRSSKGPHSRKWRRREQIKSAGMVALQLIHAGSGVGFEEGDRVSHTPVA